MLAGKQIRKNFKTRAEADAEKQILEVQSAQGETGIRTAITRLAEPQITVHSRAEAVAKYFEASRTERPGARRER